MKAEIIPIPISNDESITIDKKDNLLKELEDTQEKLEESESKYKYLLADLQNTKRRYLNIIENNSKYEGESILLEIINILDIINKMKEYSQNIQDIEYIEQSLTNILTKNEVRKIYENRPMFFNDEYDEAISFIPTDNPQFDNMIKDVFHDGYKFKDKILKYEQVVVYKYNE